MEKQKITALELIRFLSGIMSRNDAIARLAMINLLSRYLLGLTQEKFVIKQVSKLGFELEVSSDLEI